MQNKNGKKSIVKEIKKNLEVYLLTHDYKALNNAEYSHNDYLKEGGKKTLESIQRNVQREHCLIYTW